MKTKLSLSVLGLVCSVGFSSNASAYLVGRLGSAEAPNPSIPTHILVAGYSHGMGSQFLEGAVGAGLRILDAFPDRQVIILQEPEGSLSDAASTMKHKGVKVLSQSMDHLWAAEVTKMVQKYSQVASLEFFSHSSMHLGAGLVQGSGPEGRFHSETDGITKISKHFTSDGYIFLHGCNAGLAQVPEMSAVVKLPVAGALTSSDFEQLATDQAWYNNNSGNYPSSGWSSTNKVSYSSETTCKDGKCHRMRPDNHTYHGVWGEYDGGGLGFYKFFCNYSGDEQHCKRVMALSMMAWPSVKPITPSSSKADFEAVVLDFLCPTDKDQKIRKACINGIRGAVADGSFEYSPFRGNTLNCDLKGCDLEWKCQYDGEGNAVEGTCGVSAKKNNHPTTMAREYERYMDGFDLL